MKILRTLFALVFAISLSTLAHGVEYKTMVTSKTDATFISVLPTDLVEVIGKSAGYGGAINFQIQFVGAGWSSGTSELSTFTGAAQIKLHPSADSTGYITLKITSKEEATAVGPTSVLVIPENATGNYDVVVESSGDMVTWTPFVSQTGQSGTPSNFFRVRIVKK